MRNRSAAEAGLRDRIERYPCAHCMAHRTNRPILLGQCNEAALGAP
jgi:hypothetical protein